ARGRRRRSRGGRRLGDAGRPRSGHGGIRPGGRGRRRGRGARVHGHRAAGAGRGRNDDRETVFVFADRVPDVVGQVEDDARDALPVLAAANLRDRVDADGQGDPAPRVHRVLEVDDEAPQLGAPAFMAIARLAPGAVGMTIARPSSSSRIAYPTSWVRSKTMRVTPFRYWLPRICATGSMPTVRGILRHAYTVSSRSMTRRR